MDRNSLPRIHVLGAPLVEASIELLADDGTDLAAQLRGCTPTLALGRNDRQFSMDFWPHLEVQGDGLFTSNQHGNWRAPQGHISLGGPASAMPSFISSWTSTSDRVTIASENELLVSVALRDTPYVSGEGGSLYLSGRAVEIAYDFSEHGLTIGLSARLSANDRVHKGSVELGAQLRVQCLVPDNALPFLGFSSRKAQATTVEIEDWQPRQTSIGDLATTGSGIAARGTLDWNNPQSRYPSPTGPWVSCGIEKHSMSLKPVKRVARLATGLARYAGAEGILELMIGAAHFEAALNNRVRARMAFTGPGIGFVDGVTTWPMEQGGPKPQAFERLVIDLEKAAAGLRIVGEGLVGPGGDLGPDVHFDLMIPALWLRLKGYRF